MEELISKYWQEKKYIEICDMAERVLDKSQKYYENREKYGDVNPFMIDKCCAYVLVAAIMIGNDEVAELVAKRRDMACIKNIFRDEEIREWTLNALQLLNIDYVRCEYIEQIIPAEYADMFDFDKFKCRDISDNDAVPEEIIERKAMEWDVFVRKCDEVGVLDLKSIVLDFPKEFFDGETRDGFYIEPLMKHAWAANLEVLHKVDILCQTLDIPYFVDWGTLLGTVRHKGYIPWDDDIDIGVLREDYNKLKYAIQNCQNELEFYDVYEEGDWGAHASKIVNSLTFLTNRQDVKRYHGFSFFSSIDVFVIDCVPRDKRLETEQYDVLKAISEVSHLREEMKNYDPEGSEYRYAKKNEKTLVKTISRMCHVEFSQENPSNQELFILKDEVLSMYSEEQSDYYTVPHRLANGQDYYIPKEVFAGRLRMPFENIEVNVPSGYEFILQKNYGENYMTPINQGGGHGYPFYGSLIDAFVERRKGFTREETLKYIEDVSYGYYNKFLHQANTTTYQYDEEYFNEEVIDGVQISEETKRNRAAEMEVLAEIKRICDKKNLRVFAIGDTVLGAYHYKGYTPTSEGIHLGMMRDDYINFMNCLGEELDSWFTYESIYLNDNHWDMRSYITTDAYLVKDEDYMKRFHGSREIVGIDISPMDVVDPDEARDDVRKDLIAAMLRTATIVPNRPPYDQEILSLVAEWTEQIQVQIDTDGNLQRSFLRAADSVASSYREAGEYVRVTPDLQVGMDTIYPAKWFVDVVELPYENCMIPVPAGYQEMIGVSRG